MDEDSDFPCVKGVASVVNGLDTTYDYVSNYVIIVLPMNVKKVDINNTKDMHAIDSIIEDFLALKLEQSATIDPYYQELWKEIARLFRSGGKRLRSRLTTLSYRMFGGHDIESVLHAAAAVELLHLAMLIHDDIIDRDYKRYGVDNIAGRYNKLYKEMVDDEKHRLHYSHSAALLAGDLLLSEAYSMMAKTKVDAQRILDAQSLLANSVFEVIGGELLDTESVFRGKVANMAETIALYKTASYTTTLPLLIGAQLAGLSSDSQNDVRELGRSLGIAFQLRDDIIGIFGNEVETGKTTSGDIREGKHTYMIEQFYAYATHEQRTLFERHFGDSTITDDEVAQLRDVITQSGARKKTEQAINVYELNVRNVLKRLSVEKSYIMELNNLIAIVTKRIK